MKSIGVKFALVVFLTVLTVGIAGYIAGGSILGQIARLIDDTASEKALTSSREHLIELRQMRHKLAEAKLTLCAYRSPSKDCDLEGATFTKEKPAANVAADATIPGWESENTYLAKASTGEVMRLVFDWQELKPEYEKLTELIGTREHLSSLLPNLTGSFRTVFAMSLLLAGLLGLLVTYLLSRRLTLRVSDLIGYTKRIGSGELIPAPATTRGPDEIGLLADALQAMAKDLDTTRQKLVLAEKMQSWQNVARKVAHEIKNPLTPISLVASELQRRADKTNKSDSDLAAFLQETSRVLSEETESLGRMVREFSAFARLPDPDLKEDDLRELLNDFVARNKTDNGPTFALNIAAGRYQAIIDRGMITQILHNMVNNARLAKAPSPVRVTFNLRAEDENYILDIQDNGPGVSEKLRQTLFDAYVTSRSTGEGEKGMGLGLTISRKIAVDHGGSLNLENTGPEGSCFRLILPRGQFSQVNPA